MNPLDLLPKSAMALLIAVLMVTTVKLHWDKNGLVADVQIGKTQIAQLEGAIANANVKAITLTAELTNKVLKAQNDAKKREDVLVAEKHDLDSALDSLRLSTSKARATYRLSGPTATTSYQYADTGLNLLDICAKEYSDLAAKSDGHVSDIQTLISAWPTQKKE